MSSFFNKGFYDRFKNLGLEKELSVNRNGSIITDHLVGIISSEKALMLSPKVDMILKVHDHISDGFNQYVVTNISDSGGKGTVWQIAIESLDEYNRKQQITKPSVTNNISNSGTLGQNFGDSSNFSISQNNSGSLEELSNLMLKIEAKDRQQFVALITEIENLKDNEQPVKKGFLNKFDSLIGKYPNISSQVANLLFGWAVNGNIN